MLIVLEGGSWLAWNEMELKERNEMELNGMAWHNSPALQCHPMKRIAHSTQLI